MLQVRIRGGANHLEGRVEVFHDGKWGTVCADGWGIEEAMIVCRQLNLGFASDAITNQTFSQTDLEVIMSGVQCHVNDISIYNCEHDDWTNTTCSDKKKSAGVACVSGETYVISFSVTWDATAICSVINKTINITVLQKFGRAPYSPVLQLKRYPGMFK